MALPLMGRHRALLRPRFCVSRLPPPAEAELQPRGPLPAARGSLKCKGVQCPLLGQSLRAWGQRPPV